MRKPRTFRLEPPSRAAASGVDDASESGRVGDVRGELVGLAGEVQRLRDELTGARADLAAFTRRLGPTAPEVTAVSTSAEEGARRAEEAGRTDLERLQMRLQMSELESRLQRTRQQLLAAERDAARVRETLSFQLGHALIFGFKSWSGARALPARLWAIREEARRRRARRSAPSPTPSTGSSRPGWLPGRQRSPAAPHRLKTPVEALGHAAMLRSLKVATIMDEFTEGCFRDECQLFQLTPAAWREELETFRPDFLFVESAWRGKDDLWGSKVGHRSDEVRGIVEWCHTHGVPTAFWNKEDPVHFQTFLNTAGLFEHVFTTDIDCVARYRGALGHGRVHLLPFACQPKVHNPIEKYDRKDAFCFAGAYYVRYPERIRDLGNFIVSLPEHRPVEIYDRNWGKSDPNYQFPPEYHPFIVGSLPFAEIDRAYKGYRYGINLSSIKQSQSMYARRVFELLGSNTITVSNYSRGLRLMFGDLVIASDSGMELTRRLRERCGDETSADKLRLMALRKVLAEHTYQDRFAHVVSKLRDAPPGPVLPRAIVVGYPEDEAQARAIADSFEAQTYPDKALVLVARRGAWRHALRGSDLRIIHPSTARRQAPSELGGAGDWLVPMVAEDHYGANYLLDLMLATRYADGPVIGKASYHQWAPSGGTRLLRDALRYRPVASVPARSGAIRLDQVRGDLEAFVRTLAVSELRHEQALSIDPFNYCRHGRRAPMHRRGEMAVAVDDDPGLDPGLSLAELLSRAEGVAPEEEPEDRVPRLSGADLAALLAPPRDTRVVGRAVAGELELDSTLEDGKHEYWYATEDSSLADLGVKEGRLRVHLDVTPGLHVQAVFLFLDVDGQRIGHAIEAAGRNRVVEVPDGTARVRLGLRIYASGSCRVRGLLLGHRPLEPAEILGRGEHLVLTNHYPSNDDLYRNAFLHRRVLAYRERGAKVDVFRLRPGASVGYHEFEDIDCTTGSTGALDRLLASGRYRTVLVHFLDERMWEVLSRHLDHVRIVVWVHGAEIQPFERRAHNYGTEEERARAMAASERRMAFWRRILRPLPPAVRLVFVSRLFAEEVMEDLGFRLPESSYQVIHNPIDTRLFAYAPKPAWQRRRVLSIRPYVSATYANDLSVAAILELSKEPFFSELEFRLVGDGPLFDETLAPLRAFPNVVIDRGFLPQAEIARLHRSYGVFLCPSRMDSQGVSRDEAMASGLVPVTSAVAAVPEFVDEHCGFLAPPEDARGLADAIRRLVQSEALFERLSAAAAARVRRQSASERVIPQELACFAGGGEATLERRIGPARWRVLA